MLFINYYEYVVDIINNNKPYFFNKYNNNKSDIPTLTFAHNEMNMLNNI